VRTSRRAFFVYALARVVCRVSAKGCAPVQSTRFSLLFPVRPCYFRMFFGVSNCFSKTWRIARPKPAPIYRDHLIWSAAEVAPHSLKRTRRRRAYALPPSLRARWPLADPQSELAHQELIRAKGFMTGSPAPPVMISAKHLNAECQQCNDPDSDHQHRQCYGIVIEPVPTLNTHDAASPYWNFRTEPFLPAGRR
jgi:hypothetical protein